VDLSILSIELCFFIIISIPTAIVAIYKSIADKLQKTNEQQAIGVFIIYFAQIFSCLYIERIASAIQRYILGFW